MHLYGDESGQFNSLLSGDCDLFVLAVIAGENDACTRCPKRTIRNIPDASEARWNELNSTEKRRFIGCLNDSAPTLSFGFVALTRRDLLNLSDKHILYQDVANFPTWNQAVMGFGYREIVIALTKNRFGPHQFTFDRIYHKKTSDSVADIVNDITIDVTVAHDNSRRKKGIQTADCLAGAIAEDINNKGQWLAGLDLPIKDVTSETLIQLEHTLESKSTGP